MANCCFFDLTALGKKENLDRLYRIMKYEDGEYHLYRVRQVEVISFKEWKDGLFEMKLYGDVAWSSEPWINSEGYGKKGEKTGTIFTSMTHLSEVLDLAVEWYAEGDDFEEHMAVCKGKITEEDGVDKSDPSYEIGNEEDYRDGTKEDIIEDITDYYKDDLGDDFDDFIKKVSETLDWAGYVYIRIGGYDHIVDNDALWNGENRHVNRSTWYVEY